MNEFARERRMIAVLIVVGLLVAGSTAQAMMAGVLPDSPAARVDANTTSSMWNGVGSVIVGGGTYSGVLIAPRFVLTAAHVVGSASPSSVQFVLNYGGDQTHVIQALSIKKHPTESFPYDDLALIELATAAPAGVSVYPIERNTIAVGHQIALVGYGASGNGNVGVTVSASRSVKRRGWNIVNLIQTTLDASGRESLFYLYDFDAPTGNGSLGGPSTGNTFETLVAGGDSGSPAFIVDSAGPRLVGINTFVISDTAGEPIDYMFGTMGGGILLSAPEFTNWIDATIGTYGGEEDIPTLPEWAVIVGILSMTAVAARGRNVRAYHRS